MDVDIISFHIVHETLGRRSFDKWNAGTTLVWTKENIQQSTTANDFDEISMCGLIWKTSCHDCSLLCSCIRLLLWSSSGRSLIFLVKVRRRRAIILSRFPSTDVGALPILLLICERVRFWRPAHPCDTIALSFRQRRRRNRASSRMIERFESFMSFPIACRVPAYQWLDLASAIIIIYINHDKPLECLPLFLLDTKMIWGLLM